jgi:hypothetical protein
VQYSFVYHNIMFEIYGGPLVGVVRW